MPMYEYECQSCGQRIEVLQSFNDPPPTDCDCGEKDTLKKLISAPAFQFKGSGWYVTDYADKGKKAKAEAGKEGGAEAKADGGKADGGKADGGKADGGKTDGGKEKKETKSSGGADSKTSKSSDAKAT